MSVNFEVSLVRMPFHVGFAINDVYYRGGGKLVGKTYFWSRCF